VEHKGIPEVGGSWSTAQGRWPDKGADKTGEGARVFAPDLVSLYASVLVMATRMSRTVLDGHTVTELVASACPSTLLRSQTWHSELGLVAVRRYEVEPDLSPTLDLGQRVPWMLANQAAGL
jgi:hypothetical protein